MTSGSGRRAGVGWAGSWRMRDNASLRFLNFFLVFIVCNHFFSCNRVNFCELKLGRILGSGSQPAAGKEEARAGGTAGY